MVGAISPHNFYIAMYINTTYYVIQTNYGYGWEDESTYEVGTSYEQIKHDEGEYQLMGARTRLRRRKAKVEIKYIYD